MAYFQQDSELERFYREKLRLRQEFLNLYKNNSELFILSLSYEIQKRKDNQFLYAYFMPKINKPEVMWDEIEYCDEGSQERASVLINTIVSILNAPIGGIIAQKTRELDALKKVCNDFQINLKSWNYSDLLRNKIEIKSEVQNEKNKADKVETGKDKIGQENKDKKEVIDCDTCKDSNCPCHENYGEDVEEEDDCDGDCEHCQDYDCPGNCNEEGIDEDIEEDCDDCEHGDDKECLVHPDHVEDDDEWDEDYDEDEYVYHATPIMNLSHILKEGLVTVMGNPIHLWESRDKAVSIARRNGDKDIALFRVKISDLEDMGYSSNNLGCWKVMFIPPTHLERLAA